MDKKCLDIIKKRKSIRSFTSEKVSDETVAEILECGMAAPSAMDTKCREFIVINNKDVMDKMPQMLEGCSVAVAVCANTKEQNNEAYWLQDCAAAMENMLIAVESLNLGAVWIALYPEEERVKTAVELLKLPEHVKPVAIAAIGYENEKEEKPLNKEKVYNEQWG